MKEINKVFLSLFSVGIMLIAIFIGVSMTKTSYALFTDTIKGEKTIEVVVDNFLNKTTVFNYTGDSQEYEVPKDGYYYIEMAGAEGGSARYTTSYTGGKGAKTSGYVYLEKGDTLYFYVGGMGSSHSGTTTDTVTTNGNGYNGGSKGNFYASNSNAGGGGGATDVRLIGGDWDDTSSLISRIMVAGGGGGGESHIYVPSYSGYGGSGGTLYGENALQANTYCYAYGTGGTQTTGGTSPNCANGTTNTYNNPGSFGVGNDGSYSGGGGGYYGGAGGQHGAAAGGSSYISGYAGVNSVEESTTITHTNQTLHYSGKYFIGGKMIAGQNEGNGYAKITYVGTKPEKKTTKLDNVRYIKNCTNYSSYGNSNHWLEVQAIKDGVNIAKGKGVTGTTSESTSYPYSRITDGDITYTNYARPTSYSANQCITVDLGDTYDLDEIAVWNYFGDQRRYYDNIISVSSDNKNFTKIIDEASVEISNGHRINAYTDTYNGYISDNLTLWYDGNANTGSTRNMTTTTWKDLSGTGYNGTVSGATWYTDYLGLSSSAVTTNIVASNFLPANSNRTLSITLKINSVPYTNSTYGNIGVLFGAAYYSGMAISWIKNPVHEGSGFITGGGTRTSEFVHTGIESDSLNYPTKILNLTYVNDSTDNKVYYYIDGVKIGENTSVTGTYQYASTIGTIGINKNQKISGSGTASYANMNVYSARIYTKALTEDEILHNYLYDVEKFNIE